MADETPGMEQSKDPDDLHLSREARAAGNEVEVIEVIEEVDEEPTPFVDHKAFLKEDEIVIEKAEFPGGHVFVYSIDAKTRDDWEQEVGKTRGKNKQANVRNFRASLVALCSCYEDGTPFYPDWRKAVKSLGARRASVVDPVYTVAAKLNGVREEDEAEATAAF